MKIYKNRKITLTVIVLLFVLVIVKSVSAASSIQNEVCADIKTDTSEYKSTATKNTDSYTVNADASLQQVNKESENLIEEFSPICQYPELPT